MIKISFNSCNIYFYFLFYFLYLNFIINYLLPRVVPDYNKGKEYIDMTDQMGSCHTCLRKSIKWYRKLIFDIICNTSMVNALSIYTSVTGRKMAIVDFREAVI